MADDDPRPSEVSPPQKASTRVDAAHVSSSAIEREAAAGLSLADLPRAPREAHADPTAVLEQIQTQAAQLAARLRRRQRALDRRESELNSRQAAVDSEVRGARLWMEETHKRFDDRLGEVRDAEAALAERRQDLREQEGAFREREFELDAREAALGNRFTELSIAEDHSRKSLHVAEAQNERQARNLALKLAHVRSVEADGLALDGRRKNLETAENLLAEEQAELEAARERLAHDRRNFADEAAMERERMAFERKRADIELANQADITRRRADELDERETSLARLRAELIEVERQALEMRLATEELWIQLQGAAPAEAISQEIERLRARLTQNHKQELAEIAARREELLALAEKIAGEHESLSLERAEVRAWSTERNAELDARADELDRRERSLVQVVAQTRDLEDRFLAERLGYQQEIRRLLRELRRPAKRGLILGQGFPAIHHDQREADH